MLSCKDATQLISRSMDTSLTIGERIRLRLHLRICEWCARYKKQLFLIREMLRADAAGDRPAARSAETLSEEARERIRKSLRNP